jgi:cobalt/nickel transport system permease protein
MDEYTNLDSPFHRWDSGYKLIGLITLAFAFSFVRDLRVLLAMAAVTVTVYAIPRLPGAFVVKRCRYSYFFLLVIILTLPFLFGESVLMNLVPMALRQEGLLAAILIATKFAYILIVGIILLGMTPLIANIEAPKTISLLHLVSSRRYLLHKVDPSSLVTVSILHLTPSAW